MEQFYQKEQMFQSNLNSEEIVKNIANSSEDFRTNLPAVHNFVKDQEDGAKIIHENPLLKTLSEHLLYGFVQTRQGLCQKELKVQNKQEFRHDRPSVSSHTSKDTNLKITHLVHFVASYHVEK
ncbi:hypothetical protein RvY_07707 [Ramazzottius varieornatus]|uniref:Uncharacterized protein n=1 Tax=Ramazzottius varieornatus TaxID=947166 RepID=A0A1D1V374_RAMVA|nr:hypothetical protein RvY_07707 [Ramazzottius varieornatus]